VVAPLPQNRFTECPTVAMGSGVALSLPADFAAADVTLVTLAFQAMGQAQLAAWHEAFLGAFPAAVLPSRPAGAAAGADTAPPAPVRLVNLVYLQGWFFKAMSGLLSRSTLGALPENLRPASGVLFEPSGQAADVRARRAAVMRWRDLHW
jgi:hypothetical protein